MTLDGVTFDVIVHRLQRPTPHGEWLVRVYQGDDHVFSAEGGISLDGGLRSAQRSMREWCEANGVAPHVSDDPVPDPETDT